MTATVVTTKVVDLAQLVTELSGAALTMRDDGTERTIVGEVVTQAALEAAVAAHVAPDYAAQQANATTLRDRAVSALDTNRTFLALAAPTNAQTLAQVKALTRQSSAVIRLLLRKLEGTD